MYENLTAISLKMKRNLTARLITFTLKEFPVHTSKTFSFSRKEALFWHKPQSDILIAGTAILIYVGWNGHALYCPMKELNLQSDRGPQ